MRRLLKLTLLGGTVLAAAGGVAWLISARTKQTNNSIVLQNYCVRLRHARQTAQEPPDVRSEKDFFGRPLLSRESESGALLVSFGADGLPDRDYNSHVGELEKASNCYSIDTDTVFLDCKAVLTCLK